MSNLLFVFERDIPTISIMRELFSNLSNYPEIRSDFLYLMDVKSSDIDSHDVVIFMRPNDVYSSIVALRAREAGHLTVTFCDDDLLNLPTDSPTIPWRKKGLIRTLRQSDVIWSSSRYLVEKWRKLTADGRCVLSDTIIQPEQFNNTEVVADGDVVKIVYAAAPSHADLFEDLISPVLPRLAQEFGDKIKFTFISVHPDVKGVECEFLPGMPLLEYREYMKNQRFDIGLAPLKNDEFSKCKYINKFIEYTTQGIVGVYSKTEPYTYVVNDGANGFLSDDSADSWYHALSTAIRNTELRKKCLAQAVDYLKKNYTETACMERVRQAVPEFFDEPRVYDKCKGFGLHKIRYYLIRPMDWGYLFLFYLNRTGIKGVISRIKRHYVESKAYR